VTFSNPVVAGTVLVRQAVQTPNFVAGVSGWQIARDGSAEFNDLSVRGTFATGPDGINPYLTINDVSDRTTIAMWNAAGTNDAFINSPQISGIPTLGCNSGIYTLTTPGVPGYSRVWMQANRIDLQMVRSSDQSPNGGSLALTDTQARLKCSRPGLPTDGANLVLSDTIGVMSVDTAGLANGGRLRADSTDGYLEYASGGSGVNGFKASSDGIHTYGAFPSETGLSVTVQAGWTLISSLVNKWGPFVTFTFVVQKTTAAVGPGVILINAAQINGVSGPPQTLNIGFGSTTHDGGATVSTTGMVTFQNVNIAIAVGNQVRCSATYFVG
jgi:hypothetical protein